MVLSTDLFTDNEQWDLVDIVGEIYQTEAVMTVRITIKRRPFFHIAVIILPNLTIYFLSGLIFWIPVDSGEKISFGVTLLLAQAVSFGTLSEMFPASSLNFPILGIAVCAMTLHVGFLCLIATSGTCFYCNDSWLPHYPFKISEFCLVLFQGPKLVPASVSFMDQL